MDHPIYVDPEAPESVMQAAEELRSYLGKVTGAFPEILVTDRIPTKPFVSLGRTAGAMKEGLDPSDIPNDGFQIVTRGVNLFIFGPDTPTGEVNDRGGVNNGTSNGVHAFIEDYLGVRWLMPGEIGEDYRELEDLLIPPVDRMETSPFDYRELSFRDRAPLEDEWNRRMKLYRVSRIEHNHSWIQTIPPSLYEEHPEWFAMKDGKRVPPIGSYYKLESTNQEMVEYFAGRIIEAFRKDPKRRWYSLSPADGAGWSESPESRALMERDPRGDLSVTPLVLKFYSDVARIVGEDFPDHMLGGYLYSNYLYPPSEGVDSIESNLAFMIANSPTYGFKLYRPSVQEKWEESIWIDTWAELAREYEFDLYYYDLPTTLVQPNGIICPPAPDLLNFTFSRMSKYGFRGGYIYGNPIWPVSGPGNYAIARMLWNPDQDANEILHDYYVRAYGGKAGARIERLFDLLDNSFRSFYNRNPGAKYLLTEDHLKEIYAPNYQEMERLYLEALTFEKRDIEQKRLEKFGEVMSLLQWNLRDYGFLDPDYRSSLTLDEDGIDELLESQSDDCRITRKIDFRPKGVMVEGTQPMTDDGGSKEYLVPVGRGGIHLLLHASSTEQVRIDIERFHRRAEFIQYLLTDENGNRIRTGVIAEGRSVSFPCEEGKTYFLRAPYRIASLERLSVSGASIAFHVPSRGLDLDARRLEDDLPLYFYVPEETGSFHLILGKSGAAAEVYSPSGRCVGRLRNSKVNRAASRLRIPEVDSEPGFWRILIHPSDDYLTITLDEQLPQWFLPDKAQLLRIEDL
jgi:hypothetical protein